MTDAANVVAFRGPAPSQPPSVSDLARLHGVARATIYRWQKKGWTPGRTPPGQQSAPVHVRAMVKAIPGGRQIPEQDQEVYTPVHSAVLTADTPLSANAYTRARRWLPKIPAKVMHVIGHVIILAPVAGLNIWPRVHQLLGGADPAGWPYVAFQILTLVLLSQVLPRMARSAGWIPWTALAAVGLILIAANLLSSTEAIGYMRDGASAQAQSIDEQHGALSANLATAKADRAKLPAVTPTNAEQVTSAEHTVDDARTARLNECGEHGEKNGPNCRQRVKDLQDAEAKLANLQSAKAIADQTTMLDGKIGDLQQKISALGAPQKVDPLAERASILTAGWIPPDLAAKLIPMFQALVAELCALFGPWMLLG